MRPAWPAVPWLLALLGVLLYAGTARYGYVLDDRAVIVENRYVAEGASAIGTLLSTAYTAGFSGAGEALSYYRPLSLVTFALEQSLLGGSPGAAHLINAGLYGATAAVLFGVLRMVVSPPIAALAALLFVVHPLHVDVVASVKSRDELLALLLHLGTLGALLQKRSAGWVGGLALLALLAKENAVVVLATAPLVLSAAQPDRRPADIARQCTPLLAALAGYLLLRLGIAGVSLQTWSDATLTPENNVLLAADGFSERAGTTLLMAGWYLWLSVHPQPLVYDYSIGHIPLVGLGDPRALASLLAIAGAGAAAAWGWRRREPWALGLLLAGVAYAPVSNVLVLVNGSTMAERYLYAPSVGLCLAAATLLWRAPVPQARWAAAVVVVALCGVTQLRLPAWQSNAALAATDIRSAPTNSRIVGLFHATVRSRWLQLPPGPARQALADKAVPIGEHSLSQATEDTPPIVRRNLHKSLGQLYIYQGSLEKAQEQITLGLAVDDSDSRLHALQGYLFGVAGAYEDALGAYTRAVAKTADVLRGTAYNAGDLGNICSLSVELRRYDEAEAACSALLSVDAQNRKAHRLMARIAAARGDTDAAKQWEQRAEALQR